MEREERPSEAADALLEMHIAAATLRSRVEQLVLDRRAGRSTPGFRLLGAGLEQIDAGLAALEPTARSSVWTMQPIMSWDPQNGMLEIDDQTRRRGLDFCFVTRERTAEVFPLLSSEMPHVRFGPAPAQFILVDGVTAVLGGPPDDDGYPTAWLTTRAELVTLVRGIWDIARPLSRAGVPAGAEPPFTARQCLIARRMVLGAKDAAIARELGVSVRTVAAEVAALMEGLGAASRAEAALVLRGGSDRQADVRRRGMGGGGR
ncbi:helix-turn-helix transcriptional regulator [Intrasporangium sp. YIM S08009]|uniref:helix-turn-helix domain-containing protein n=1 Tax=Intrasporangium zincisolvens TaxID=3080018 RepID=UPI002B06144E|nr:helix-turn-helix transcriptional regulator [Intrasporangium sp. YIM S08009]